MSLQLGTLALAALVSLAGVQKPAPAPQPTGPFAAGKDLLCSFPVFGTASWNSAPPVVVDGKQDMKFGIGAIDYKKKSAVIVGTSSARVLVTAALTSTGLTVIEETPIGNFNITTVFAGGAHNDTFFAVHSRHLGDISAPPTASQSYGTCTFVQPQQ